MFDYASVAQLVEQLICNQRVGGSNPLAGFFAAELLLAFVNNMGRYQSGQMGRAVNPLGEPFGGSNPSLPNWASGNSSVGRATAFQAVSRGFESRFPLYSSAWMPT
jgi:hypothetical protein